MGSDKEFAEAHHALIDPLVEPQPNEETGLNSHFGSTFAPRQNPTPPNSAGIKDSHSVNIRPHNTGSSVETNPYRRARAGSSNKGSTVVDYGEVPSTPKHRHLYPSPPNSASPRREQFPQYQPMPNYRSEAFGSMSTGRPRRSSQPNPSNASNREHSGGLARSGSLRERYPGDNSHRPLDTLRKDNKTAYRAHHLRKKNFQGADVIDRLDKSTFQYHHEGPYDAASLARNLSYTHSPIAAVQDSNEEALRATPRENIVDAVTKHRPLEGVANIPPGMPDRFGRVLDYEEGADLQREPGGDYRRWPGVQYLPGDLKGKGEPSYSIEKALKDHKQYGDTGTEMRSHRRHQSAPDAAAATASGNAAPQPVWDDTPEGEHHSSGKSIGGALKKRFGSLRRRKVEA